MGTKIQVAIQGGGAKIIGLVAAMEVLQKMEAAGEVEITRLAGTSAGAIVAALYSAKIDMGQLRLSLGTGELRELFENYEKPGKIEIIKRLVEGTPICDPGPIREFLRKLLEHAEKTYVNDLNPKVRIVSANVAKSSKHDHKDEDKLLEALMSTSALPFVFRVWDTRRQPEPPRSRWKKFYHKYIATPPHPEEKAEALRDNDAEKPWLVDGGICENLPISELLAGEHQLGPVVAITFSTDKYFRPADILGFGKAVLDTAIDNSVHRARSLLPPSAIFEIGPWFPISTLDFGEAIKAAGDVTGPGKAYKRVTDEAVKFFKRYIQRQRDGNPATSYDPWRSDNTTVRKILEANWDVSTAFCRSKYLYERVSMVVTLFGGEGIDHRADRLVLKVQFAVLAEPLIAIRMCVMNTINLDYLGRTSWTIRTVPGPQTGAESRDLEVTAVPVKDPKEPDQRWIVLYFNEPLPAHSGSYELEIIDYADSVMADLKAKGEEVLRIVPQRATGMTQRLELAVVYNTTKWKLKSKKDPEYRHLPHEELTTADKDRIRGTLEHDRYKVTGFALTNIMEAKAAIIIELNQ